MADPIVINAPITLPPVIEITAPISLGGGVGAAATLSTTPPENPIPGQFWEDAEDGALAYWDGTVWVGLNNPPVSADVAALLAASDASAARDALNIGEIIYAKDFGVVADNVADDTAALQAALDAAGASGKSQIVWLPPGIMKITAELVVKNRVSLYGHGWAKTIIYGTTPGQNGIWLNSMLHDTCEFHGFSLYGPAGHGGDGVATGVGILCDSKTAAGTYVFGPTHFKGLWVSRWATSLKLGQMPLTIAEQCYFGGYKYFGVHMVSTDTFLFNACSIGTGFAIDQVQAGGTTIKLEGSLAEPTGTNFAGEFRNCEFGDTWKFLTLSGCRMGFDSCNFESRGGAEGLVTARTLFDVSGGARLFLKNCRFGLGATATDAGSEPLAVIRGDCSSGSAEPRIILDNTEPNSGLYTLAVSMVGNSCGYFSPYIFNCSPTVKWFNAALTEQGSAPQYSASDQRRMHDWFSAVTNTHANARARRGSELDYWVGGGDSTRGDDNRLICRKTRKSLAGVIQFTRSSLSNDSLMEVLAASITATATTSASAKVLTEPVPTLMSGTLSGSGDKLVLHARGVCTANANVKTLSLGFAGTAFAATSLTITDASAVYWEYQVEIYGNDVGVGSAGRLVPSLTAYNAAGLQVHQKQLSTTVSGFTADTVISVIGQSATSGDITCHGWDLVWRANSYKP